jgi:hypothetical protein
MTHNGKESSSQHRLGKCVSGDAKVLPKETKGEKNMDSTNEIRQLSQEEVENLKSFREERKKDRTYIKFEDGETRILKFDTTKRAIREPSEVYKDKINYVFSVIEPSVGLDVKTWSVSPTVADQIYTELAKGYVTLKITRNGLDKSTRYTTVGVQ